MLTIEEGPKATMTTTEKTALFTPRMQVTERSQSGTCCQCAYEGESANQEIVVRTEWDTTWPKQKLISRTSWCNNCGSDVEYP